MLLFFSATSPDRRADHRRTPAPPGRSQRANSQPSGGSPSPPLSAPTLSQQKIIKKELALTSRERAAAGTTGDFVLNHFGISFDPDDAIKRMAVRANER
jgi:hypothetical protein